MKVILQCRINTNSVHLFNFTENIIEDVTNAARDGDNISILKDLVKGKFSQALAKQEQELINSAVQYARLRLTRIKIL